MAAPDSDAHTDQRRLLTEAVRIVMGDMAPDIPSLPIIELEPAPATGEWDIIVGFDVDLSVGFRVDMQDRERVLASVADGLQSACIEGFRTAVPRCPGHDHPMVVDFEAHGSRWVCPATDEERFVIGGVRGPGVSGPGPRGPGSRPGGPGTPA